MHNHYNATIAYPIHFNLVSISFQFLYNEERSHYNLSQFITAANQCKDILIESKLYLNKGVGGLYKTGGLRGDSFKEIAYQRSLLLRT